MNLNEYDEWYLFFFINHFQIEAELKAFVEMVVEIILYNKI